MMGANQTFSLARPARWRRRIRTLRGHQRGSRSRFWRTIELFGRASIEAAGGRQSTFRMWMMGMSRMPLEESLLKAWSFGPIQSINTGACSVQSQVHGTTYISPLSPYLSRVPCVCHCHTTGAPRRLHQPSSQPNNNTYLYCHVS